MSRTLLVVAVIVVIILIVVFGVFFFFKLQKPTTSSLEIATSSASSFVPATPVADEGLIINDVVVGDGADVIFDPSYHLQITYIGYYGDGTVFDSTHSKTPYSFTLGASNPPVGWVQGLLGMKVGGTRILTILPSFAGRAQYVNIFPATSTVVYKIQLLSVSDVHTGGEDVPPPGTPQLQPGF